LNADRDHGTGGRGGVLPARLGSTRFPGKPLADLHGLPLIVHAVRRARKIGGLSRVIVATDDERIAGVVRDDGGEAVLTGADHPSGTDRVGEVVRGLDPAPSFVLNLQGDEPLLPIDDVAEMVLSMAREPDAIWTLAHPLDSEEDWVRSSVVKVVVARDGRALYFSRAPVPFARNAGHYVPRRHVGIYGFPRQLLERMLALPPSPLELCEGLEQLRALEAGIPIRVQAAGTGSPGVDVPEDLERLKRAYPTREAWERAP
jgi:3-deoxy-manno-octulosonate cytidylyltransferase (CMP-KDO synthetase)